MGGPCAGKDFVYRLGEVEVEGLKELLVDKGFQPDHSRAWALFAENAYVGVIEIDRFILHGCGLLSVKKGSGGFGKK